MRAYAGLLVDGFDDSRVCLSRELDQKTVGDFGFDANDSRNFLVQKEPRERQRRFKSESQSIPSSCMRKTEGDNPVGSAFGANPN